MEFDRRKAAAMAAIASPSTDRSPKGTIDAPIIPLLDFINVQPSYFTTSSCSGRISILCHPTNPGFQPQDGIDKSKKKKAGGGRWAFLSHDPADPDAVVDLLFGDGHRPGDSMEGSLVFRFEPLIIAIECRDVAAAQAIVSAAISSGFRESGITNAQKRVMVAIRCSIRLEVPLGSMGLILVSPDYVRYLVGIANDKMEANKRRMDCFLAVIQDKGLPLSVKENGNVPKAHESMGAENFLLELEVRENDASSKIARDESLKFHTKDDFADSAVEFCGEEGSADVSSKIQVEYSNCVQSIKDESYRDGKTRKDSNLGISKCSISVQMLVICGEPIEKLFLWGHSACTLNINNEEGIIVFGGFGGLGRHARRSCTLLLEPKSGLLKEIHAEEPPSPRLGHTSLMVGDRVFVIGGRGGTMQSLNDVWVLNIAQKRWTSLGCTDTVFQPRHRHAAAAVGSNIYVFGGLSDEVIHSSMNVLDTETLKWSEVGMQGEWPSARHSHSMVADGSQLFMFGGYDGWNALGDLYSFDSRTNYWKIEKTTGRAPFPRFSHSMFLYSDHLGILGGCPVRKCNQELALLNLHTHVWLHVTIDLLGRELWVRSSTCVVHDDLIIVGGGASCYAFGTKFSEPMKINLHFLESLYDKEDTAVRQCSALTANGSSTYDCSLLDISPEPSNCCLGPEGNWNGLDIEHLVLQLDKKHAKLAKDILKKFAWLDLSRKVQPSEDGSSVNLPVVRNFYALFKKDSFDSVDTLDSLDVLDQGASPSGRIPSVNDISSPTALNFLLSCGGSLLISETICHKKVSKPPQKMMRELVGSLLNRKGMQPWLLEQLPARWERLGDIVVLPVTAFKDPIWDSISEELWPIVAKSLGAQRVARQGRVLPTGTRESTLEIVVGDDSWVTHQENGIFYSFDATKCMFSFGNLSEKLRMGHLDCRDEIVVDLFAGIGYFVLPFLVKAKAKLVYACEWNPYALKALQHNILANSVADRCVILEGDNRVTAPKSVADRVCLGLLPSSECSWVAAVRALRVQGGILHIHGIVNDSDESSWSEYVVKSIGRIAESEGLCWDVSIEHVEQVKWYGPHVRHLVADVRCKHS